LFDRDHLALHLSELRRRLLITADEERCCPKTSAQNAIGAILWLDENLAGLMLIEPRCFGMKNAPTK
jgi:hypothetical protein